MFENVSRTCKYDNITSKLLKHFVKMKCLCWILIDIFAYSSCLRERKFALGRAAVDYHDVSVKIPTVQHKQFAYYFIGILVGNWLHSIYWELLNFTFFLFIYEMCHKTSKLGDLAFWIGETAGLFWSFKFGDSVWQIRFMIIEYLYGFFKKPEEISNTPKEGAVFTTEGFRFSKVSAIRTITYFWRKIIAFKTLYKHWKWRSTPFQGWLSLKPPFENLNVEHFWICW